MSEESMSDSGDNLLPPGFIDALRGIYLGDSHLRPAWDVEGPRLKLLFPLLARAIAFNYEFVSPIDAGGSGVVAQVRDKNLDVIRVLKVPRPTPGREEFLLDALTTEADALRTFTHPNIISIFARGRVLFGDDTYPYYVMAYVPGALGLAKHIGSVVTTRADVLKGLEGVATAIQHMHDRGYVHLDIKPDNVLVDALGNPLLSDLGFAKSLQPPPDEPPQKMVRVGGTTRYMHPELLDLTNVSSDSNRRRGELPRSKLRKAWDLYSLGITLLELERLLEARDPELWPAYYRRAMRLLAARLMDGQESESDRPDNLAKDAMLELKYPSISDAAVDLSKLSGRFNLPAEVPELDTQSPSVIQASSLTPTVMTERIAAILQDPAMLRLGNTHQLGLLNLLYPTATHTRREHSMGTYAVACMYVSALFNDPDNPFFSQIMRVEDIEAVLLAALTHDIGHFPLAHDLEEADPTTFSHTKVGQAYLRDSGSIVHSLIASATWRTSPERVVDILTANPDKEKLRGSLRDRILHSIVDGPIDADKLDYLTRDSEALALPYGRVIDISRFLRSLTVGHHVVDGKTIAQLAIHEKGKVLAEAVAFARYAMHGQVYWHHSYRSIKAMISQLVWEMVESANKQGRLKRMRSSFAQFIVPQAQVQASPVMSGVFPNGSRIHGSDRAVLDWIAAEIAYGPAYVRMLEERRLFKRVLVLSERGESRDLVNDLLALPQGKGSWKQRLVLQRAFQDAVVRRVTAMDTSHLGEIDAQIRTRFVEKAKKMPVLLVDIPQDKSESRPEYLAEEGRLRISQGQAFRPEPMLERSLVWRYLLSDIRRSAGKIRVFSDSDYASFVTSHIERAELTDILAEAVDKTNMREPSS